MGLAAPKVKPEGSRRAALLGLPVGNGPAIGRRFDRRPPIEGQCKVRQAGAGGQVKPEDVATLDEQGFAVAGEPRPLHPVQTLRTPSQVAQRFLPTRGHVDL